MLKNNLIRVDFKQHNAESKSEDFNQKWFELLVDDKLDNMLEFESIAENSKSEMLAIMKYRRLLMERGRGQNIKKYELKLANGYGEECLQGCLQELFLEPIELGHIEYLQKLASRKKLTIEDVLDKIYDRHLEDTGLRMLSVALTI